MDLGGYGGLGVRYARLLERNTALACTEFAFLFEHVLSIGSSACGTWMSADETAEQSHADELTLRFGGTVVRYHLVEMDAFNFSLGTTAGVGSIEFVQDDDVRRSDKLIVFEPEVGVHTNLTD